MVSTFASPGPFKQQVVDELRTLRREGVTAKPILRTEDLSVVSNSFRQVELRQVVIFDARFYDEEGRNVTDESGRERLTVEWVLTSTARGWLISESNILDAEPTQ